MNLVDSCGWLEYFANGKNASFFAPFIEDEARLLVLMIVVVEVIPICIRKENKARSCRQCCSTAR